MQQRIRPNLWFDAEAEEAAQFYISVFDNSRIVNVTPDTMLQMRKLDLGALCAAADGVTA